MWEQIQPVLTAIVLVGGALAVIYKWVKPLFNIKVTVEHNVEEISRLKQHAKSDLETLEQLQELSKAQCGAMLCIINHMITGNGVENMKKTRDSIQELLIKM